MRLIPCWGCIRVVRCSTLHFSYYAVVATNREKKSCAMYCYCCNIELVLQMKANCVSWCVVAFSSAALSLWLAYAFCLPSSL